MLIKYFFGLSSFLTDNTLQPNYKTDFGPHFVSYIKWRRCSNISSASVRSSYTTRSISIIKLNWGSSFPTSQRAQFSVWRFIMPTSHKVKQVFMYAACCFCLILTEPQISRQILIKLPHIKLGESPSSWSRAAACVRISHAKTDKKWQNGSYSYLETIVKPTSGICGELLPQ